MAPSLATINFDTTSQSSYAYFVGVFLGCTSGAMWRFGPKNIQEMLFASSCGTAGTWMLWQGVTKQRDCLGKYSAEVLGSGGRPGGGSLKVTANAVTHTIPCANIKEITSARFWTIPGKGTEGWTTQAYRSSSFGGDTVVAVPGGNGRLTAVSLRDPQAFPTDMHPLKAERTADGVLADHVLFGPLEMGPVTKPFMAELEKCVTRASAFQA